MPAWLRYTLLRVGLFAAAFVVLLLVGLQWFWAALIATVVAFCVSYIFFRGLRLEVAGDWASRRPHPTRDDEAEDAALDGRVPGPDASRAEGPRAPGPAGSPGSAGDREGQRRSEP